MKWFNFTNQKRITMFPGLGLAFIIGTMVWPLIHGVAIGAVPQLINFQGILRDGSGNPVANGSYSVTFTVYDAAVGGTALWAETSSVNTTSGLFTTLLGADNPLPDSVFNDSSRYLGIKVAADPEMTPRQRLVSGAYSLRVAHFIPDYGVDNTFIGQNAGNLMMTDTKNTASGAYALHSNTTGRSNTASGAYALYSNTSNYNTASGVEALYSNTASGALALQGNTTGSANTASGDSALYSNSTGSDNTASGGSALYRNSTGILNTASGRGALYSNTIGYYNTASGGYALQSNTTGYYNTASGAGALYRNTTGIYNTASGADALFNNTGGNSNTAVGYSALSGNTTGFFNTAIGYGANVAISTMSNATAIGANAIVDASDKIRLGNSFVTVIEGQVAYTFTSDKNEKENFRPVDGEEVLRKIQGLPLSSWNYKGHDPKQFRHYGPMAQDFFAAFGDDGVGKIGMETTLNSGDVAGILMVAVQALGDENAELKARMEELEKKLKELQAEKPQAEVR